MAEHGVTGGIVAIGDNFVRHRMVEQIRRLAPQFRFISAVHPSAQLARGVSVGCGSAVMAGVVINSNSKIGEHCIINTGASVDHDNVLDRFSSIGPGAVTGGNVRLGEFSVLAMSASVIHGRSIGAQSIIGAGATVLHDVPANVVAYGTPARVIRGRNPGDKYL
jgi:sugar O-acyltransferase (sialic acid O-acetyltransferase NeuD family)